MAEAPAISGPLSITRSNLEDGSVYYAIRPDIWRVMRRRITYEELHERGSRMAGLGYGEDSQLLKRSFLTAYYANLRDKFGPTWRHQVAARILVESTHESNGMVIEISKWDAYADRLERKWSNHGIIRISPRGIPVNIPIADSAKAVRDVLDAIMNAAAASIHEVAWARRGPLVHSYASSSGLPEVARSRKSRSRTYSQRKHTRKHTRRLRQMR
jgi:hypothetical protein